MSYENCRELIESIRAQGRQEVPAIVRRLTNNPDFDFEVICGARRHWSVSWLNANNYRDIKFLVEPREMEDEEAFRIADLENRAREDLTDYERAKDYLLGLDRALSWSPKTMADRLNVSEAWLAGHSTLLDCLKQSLGHLLARMIFGLSM
ncbi:ParB/RepB/Spo0J family partition protein (plasmid) [Komagataeibacter oboediens]|nr:ParB/RepB/Spo0J family partition protein [Komagataeibacter oboediens]